MTDILAKSPAQGGTLLTDHTKMVLNLSHNIMKGFLCSSDENMRDLLLSVILHDIGKCSDKYQKIMNSSGELDQEDVEVPELKKNDVFFYHNTISWAFALACIKGIRPTGSNPYRHYPVISSVLYHHTVRNDEKTTAGDVMSSLGEDEIKSMTDFYEEMCGYVRDTFGIDILSDPDFNLVSDPYEYVGHPLSDEKLFVNPKNKFFKDRGLGHYSDFTSRAIINRAILNYSDRIISGRSYDNSRILSNDTLYIATVFDERMNRSTPVPDFSGYDMSRLKIQSDVVDGCISASENTNIICASAGFGKTLMGILTYLRTGRKTLWVLPTLELCRSTYRSVTDELKSLNISDGVSVGLFFSNEFQEGNMDSDIIIIGIDALLGRLSKNSLTPLFLDAVSADVIFDEYHEFLMSEPLFAGFINLIKTRKDYAGSSTVLLSATPLNLNVVWGPKNIKYWNDMPILGEDVRVRIGHKKIESVLGKETVDDRENSITIMPTVDSAQNSYIKSAGNPILIHARFLTEERKKRIDEVFAVYGKKSGTAFKRPLIGTSIIGTGFNISAKILNDYIITPMRTIQTIGRGSRFCEYDEIEYNVITSSLETDKGIKKLISTSACLTMRTQWVDLLTGYDGKTLTKKEIYEIYNDFMKKYEKVWNGYITSCFEKSADNLTNIRYVSGYYKKSDDDRLSGSYTYRGEGGSVYTTCLLDDGTYLDPMVCDESILYREIEKDCPKDRYYFMLSGIFKFPDKNELKYKWHIAGNTMATVEKCSDLAKSRNTPLLLCNYNYNSTLGLFRKDIF